MKDFSLQKCHKNKSTLIAFYFILLYINTSPTRTCVQLYKMEDSYYMFWHVCVSAYALIIIVSYSHQLSLSIYLSIYLTLAFLFIVSCLSVCTSLIFGRCPWCSRYRRRKWTRRYEFKSWTKLIAFHIALIPLGKVWIQLFSLQLWVNSRID